MPCAVTRYAVTGLPLSTARFHVTLTRPGPLIVPTSAGGNGRLGGAGSAGGAGRSALCR